MRTSPTILALGGLLLCAASGAAHADPVYVDASMSPGVGGDGASWGAAFERVQQGIDAAESAGGGEVWVREGTYYENVIIPDGVAVYGGFAGGEATLGERDPAKHVTVIDGGLLRSTVTLVGGPTTRVDGFTIQRGAADTYRGQGGCVFAGGTSVVANNVIRGASVAGNGGGVYAAGDIGLDGPTVVGNLIQDNSAMGGGGIFAMSGRPHITGNVFLLNNPSGIHTVATSAIVAGNVFLGGRDALSMIQDHAARVVNNVFAGNRTAILADENMPPQPAAFIANNYFVANGIAIGSRRPIPLVSPVVNNAFFQNREPLRDFTLDASNLEVDCRLNSQSLTGGFHLTPGSPCIDAGLASALPPEVLTDRDGEPRVVGTAPDIGPDEVAYPLTLLTATGTAGRYPWFTTAVDVSLRVLGGPPLQDLTGTFYSLDGGAHWSAAVANPITLSDEGVVTRLAYRSSGWDGTATVWELPKEVVIGVDTRAPVTDAVIPTPPSSGWYTSPPTITLSASDPLPGSGLDTFRWGCGVAAGTTYTGPFEFSCDGGPSYLVYEARDVAGNAQKVSVPLMVDTVPPQAWVSGFDSYPPSGWHKADAVAYVSASNPGSGVERIEHGLDGSTWQATLGPVTISGEGLLTLHTRAWDPLGRVGPASQTPVWIDRTPPVTTPTLTGTGAGGLYTSDVTITLNATDALSGVDQVRYSLDGGATWQQVGQGASFTVTAEETTTVAFFSTDVATNQESAGEITFTIDRTPPSIDSTSPADGATGVSRTTAIRVTYSEPIAAGPSLTSVAVTCSRRGQTGVVPIRPPTVSGRVLTIRPRQALPARATCTVSLPAGVVRDVAGLQSSVYSFGFTTR